MATSPRLKYPFVAGMGMTVYLVTANVTAAKIAAAASSRVLTISTSLVCGFAQKQKTPELGRPGGTQAPTPRNLRLIRTIPSTPEFHRATAPARPILDRGSWMLDVSRLNPISRIQYPRSFRKGLTGCHRRSGIGPKSPVCNLQSTVNLGLPTAYR